jgi:hypothetical protein
MKIVRKLLSADELTPSNTRWNETCNCIETTNDGGETWVQNDGADPRANPAYQRPALTTDDPRCDAASAMSLRVKSIIDGFINTATLTGAATAIFGVISILFPPAAIVAAILAFAEFLLVIGVIDVAATMTTETYDTLTCIFLANVDVNGQVDETAFAQIYTDIESQLSEGAAGISERALDLLGIVGLNNAGSAATEPGDCNCGWEITLDFTAHPYGFLDVENVYIDTDFSGTTAEWIDGLGYGHLTSGDDNHLRVCFLYIRFTLGDGALTFFKVTSGEAVWTLAADYGTFWEQYSADDCSGVVASFPYPGSTTDAPTLTYSDDYTSCQALGQQMTPAVGDPYLGYLTSVTLRGTGAKPNVVYP